MHMKVMEKQWENHKTWLGDESPACLLPTAQLTMCFRLLIKRIESVFLLEEPGQAMDNVLLWSLG